MAARNQATPVPAGDTPPPAPPVDEQPPAPPVDEQPPAPPVDEQPPAPPVDQAEVVAGRIADALEAIDAANPSVVREDPDEDPDPDPPVYDERGNVRPRGTPGARPMTKAERTKIAHALARGERIVTTAEKPRKG